MRVQANYPIGQGCKPIRAKGKDPLHFLNGRCECHPEYHLPRCLGCGELFHSSQSHTKTCSNRCRMRLSRMRHDKMYQMVLMAADGKAMQQWQSEK